MRNAQLYEYVKTVRVANATAAGVTAINCTHVDMTGFDAVQFECLLGTLTATQVTSLKAQMGAAVNDSDMADIVGAATAAAADADSNKVLIVDVMRVNNKQFVRAVVNRATANAVVDGVLAHLYRGRSLPITADATVSQVKGLVAP